MPLPRVLESYDPVLAGRSRVAGLVAQVVRLVPKEADKYGFVLWVDEQSHLLLRVDMVDKEGNLVEQVLGVDLDRQPAPAPGLSPWPAASCPKRWHWKTPIPLPSRP